MKYSIKMKNTFVSTPISIAIGYFTVILATGSITDSPPFMNYEKDLNNSLAVQVNARLGTSCIKILLKIHSILPLMFYFCRPWLFAYWSKDSSRTPTIPLLLCFHCVLPLNTLLPHYDCISLVVAYSPLEIPAKQVLYS